MGDHLCKDSDRVGCCEIGVLWRLLGGVNVTVILEIPPCVVHFGKGNLAAVEGL